MPTARLGHWASAFDAVDGRRESATALAAASWISDRLSWQQQRFDDRFRDLGPPARQGFESSAASLGRLV